MRDVKLLAQSCIVDYDGGGDLGVVVEFAPPRLA
jgi:hypothetical protein